MEVPLYSVLFISVSDYESFIMDGTLEQFGWEKETWLQTRDKFMTTRLKTDKQRPWSVVKREDLEGMERVLGEIGGGFWEVARERMVELFAELDWAELTALEEDERIARVERLAHKRFAGTNEEASARYDERHG